MTTWNEKHETDKCWGEVRNILMGELVIGVPMTFVSENHGYVSVHRGINFSFEWQCCNVDRMRSDGTSRHKDHATNQTDVVRWMTGKHNSCREMRWSLQESEWK